MTFVQPKKHSSALTKILILLLIVVGVGAFRLVVIYNRVVNLEHGIAEMKSGFVKLETENAELKEKVFALFTTQTIDAFAVEHGLMQEKKPHYFTTSDQWVFASL